MVKNEMNFLQDSDVVYKLIGPVLVKQETDEARLTVDKRLEFISKEM
jgi:prefoldin beta subunit